MRNGSTNTISSWDDMGISLIRNRAENWKGWKSSGENERCQNRFVGALLNSGRQVGDKVFERLAVFYIYLSTHNTITYLSTGMNDQYEKKRVI